MVSIVMLAWNRKDDVRESLKNIYLCHYAPLEVIVVDNFSTDGTAQMIEQEFSGVRLIKLPRNMGIEGFNIGFLNAKGKYILVLDDDSYPEKDSINKMVNEFETYPDIGVVGFNIINTHSGVSENERRLNGATSVDDLYFVGCGAGIRRNCFEKVGLYESSLFLYVNEIEFTIRCWEAGYRVVIYKDIIAYHSVSPVNRSSWRRFYYVYRNEIFIIIKYLPFPQDCIKTFGKLLKATIDGVSNRYFRYLFKLYLDAAKLVFMRKNKVKSPRTKEILRLRWNINAN